MADNSEEGDYTSELGKILRNHFLGILKPFKKRCRGIIKGEIDFTPVLKSPKAKNPSKKSKGKERKSIVITKQTVSFAFDGDHQQALRRFPGIDAVLSKLHGWKIKAVKRESARIYDMYYSHATLGKMKLRSAIKKKKKLRSVNEVVNYLLPEGYTKLYSKKGKKKGNEVKDENNNPESNGRKRKRGRGRGKNKVKKVSRKRKNGVFLGASSSSSSQKNEEKSIILREEVTAESSEMQILIPSDDGKLDDMLDNYAADSDKWIVAVTNEKKIEEDLDEEFPEYDDLANQFFN